jgi:hypothetical protein
MAVVLRSLRKIFQTETKAEMAKLAHSPASLLTLKDLEHLPEPVRKYIAYCGYLGRNKTLNASIKWKDVLFRNGPGKSWMHIDYLQFNAAPEPTRMAYIHSSMMGVLPFEGYDKYKDGHGSMQIRLLKLLEVAEYTGREMDASALVTILSESVFLPAYVLQDYVEWEPVNAQAALAKMHYNNTTVGGIFHFSSEGLFERFETNDRYFAAEGSKYEKFPWSVTVSCYQELDNLKYPSHATATWHLPDGDFDYFKGTIDEVAFNVTL